MHREKNLQLSFYKPHYAPAPNAHPNATGGDVRLHIQSSLLDCQPIATVTPTSQPYFAGYIGDWRLDLPLPSQILGVRPQSEQEISSHLKAKPVTSHAGRNFQEIRYNALVHAFDSLLRNYDPNSVEDRLVLVTHSRHRINLKAATKNITARVNKAAPLTGTVKYLQGICESLSNGP